MFSGKTEELIRRLNRATIARKNVEIFKPMLDNRYSQDEVVSHSNHRIPSIAVSSSESILLMAEDKDVIGIDEAQFFDENLPTVCSKLADKGIRVIIAGLDMDYLGQPFGIMPRLMAIADEVNKVHAVCMQCGETALFSHRLVDNKDKVFLGEKNEYEPRCRNCNKI
jgi:thymidine kinase